MLNEFAIRLFALVIPNLSTDLLIGSDGPHEVAAIIHFEKVHLVFVKNDQSLVFLKTSSIDSEHLSDMMFEDFIVERISLMSGSKISINSILGKKIIMVDMRDRRFLEDDEINVDINGHVLSSMGMVILKS